MLGVLWYKASQLVYNFDKTLATKMIYFQHIKKWPNLKEPELFNEKLQWLKLNYINENIYLCADKFKVYSYVDNKGFNGLLNELIAVYDTPDEIKWDLLPNKFAIKCTHGSGFNIICENKNALDIEQVKQLLSKWMKLDYSIRSFEPQYKKVTPKIIVEKYIENKDGGFPTDYKIYCFNGVPKLVLVCTEREKNTKLDFFDVEWNRLEVGHKKDQNKIEPSKPLCFDEMLKYSIALSAEFPFVRLDFYDNDGVVILGEFTFTPAANISTNYNGYGNKYLGDLLDISNL